MRGIRPIKPKTYPPMVSYSAVLSEMPSRWFTSSRPTAPSTNMSPPGNCRKRLSASSCSSTISPTSSSKQSSSDTMPLNAPYSSATMARWFCVRCISRINSATGLPSGTTWASRISVRIDSLPPPSRSTRIKSLVFTVPATSSISSSSTRITGMRLNWCSMATVRAAEMVTVSSTVMTS